MTTPDRHGDFIALAVTSVEQYEAALMLTTDSLLSGTLPKRSWVRLDKVFTLSSSNVVKIFGRVSATVMKEVVSGACEVMGLAAD